MQKRVLATLLGVAMVTSLLVGCGNEADSTAETVTETTTEETQEAEVTAETAGGKITVYSPQADADRGPWITERASQDLDFEVEFLCATGGDLSERLIAEKANPQADVVMGLVQTAMYQLKAEDILSPYTPSWTEGLPEVYKDKDGYFNSFWQTPIVMSYNTDYLSAEEAPTSWLALTNPNFKEMYSIPNTTSQTIRTYIIGILWHYYDETTGEVSEEGWDYLREFFANARTLPAADTDIYALMKDGEMPIMLNWFGGIKNNCATNEIPVAYVTPEDGTPVVAEAIGIVKGSKNEELAQKFVDWWGSAEVMSDYATEFGQAPAHPEAIALCPEGVKADAEMFKAQDINWEVASSKLDEWFEKIELEIMP